MEGRRIVNCMSCMSNGFLFVDIIIMGGEGEGEVEGEEEGEGEGEGEGEVHRRRYGRHLLE